MIPAMPLSHRTEPAASRSLASVLVGLPGWMVARLRSAPAELSTMARQNLIPWLRARRAGRHLCHLSGPATATSQGGVVAVSPFYGNYSLLPAFLDHHRGLGIAEFVFLDLSAAGGLARHLAEAAGCAVWRPSDEPAPGQVLYLLNYLRERYATGRWCLSLEPSEMFVFQRSEARKIGDLTEFLQSEGRGHVHAAIVEMYGEQPAAGFEFSPGEHPLDALPYFDPTGYTIVSDNGPCGNVVLQGGVQRRTVFAQDPRQSPALNRIPLVKWGRFHAYLAGTQLLTPYRLNAPHYRYHTTPTACLLRFALLDGEAVLAAAARAEAQGAESELRVPFYAGVAALRRMQLKREFSVRFNTSADLVECGLLNPGQWF
jgi:hypothetical protein